MRVRLSTGAFVCTAQVPWRAIRRKFWKNRSYNTRDVEECAGCDICGDLLPSTDSFSCDTVEADPGCLDCLQCDDSTIAPLIQMTVLVGMGCCSVTLPSFFSSLIKGPALRLRGSVPTSSLVRLVLRLHRCLGIRIFVRVRRERGTTTDPCSSRQ